MDQRDSLLNTESGEYSCIFFGAAAKPYPKWSPLREPVSRGRVVFLVFPSAELQLNSKLKTQEAFSEEAELPRGGGTV